MDNNEKSTFDFCRNIDEKEVENYLCKQAKIELELVNQLLPPPIIWQEIENEITVLESKECVKTLDANKSPAIWALSMVASVSLVCMSWLMWSNYSLQQQLEQVLFVNQTLEIQLVQGSIPTFHQTQLLSKIHLIDLQLMKAITAENKLSILQQRQKLMAEMVKTSKGNDYEYSI